MDPSSPLRREAARPEGGEEQARDRLVLLDRGTVDIERREGDADRPSPAHRPPRSPAGTSPGKQERLGTGSSVTSTKYRWGHWCFAAENVSARIEGHVEGEILAQDTLIVGESAEVQAQISGTSVVVHGRVTGDITARKQLEIRAADRVIGNVTTPSLVIHEGVVSNGRCTMGGPVSFPQTPSATE